MQMSVFEVSVLPHTAIPYPDAFASPMHICPPERVMTVHFVLELPAR